MEALTLTAMPARFPSAQKGQAFLVAILIAAIAGAALVYRLSASAVSLQQQDSRTAAALAQARDALIGSAAAENNRPGALPCPDADNDGTADGPIGFPGNNCQSYVGRLPWRTLGLPDIRDGAGEHLWYALTPVYRDYQSAGVLNPDTAGQFTVKSGGGTVLDNSAIAVIIAPGAPVGTQTRAPGTADETNIAMYLEGENANGDAIYSVGLPTAAFNDRLVYITREALFSGIVPRVAKEVRSAIENYRTANNVYPSANTYIADIAAFLPSWFSSNNWGSYTYYDVSNTCTISNPGQQLRCDTDGGPNPLVVANVTTNAKIVVMVSGPTRSGLTCTTSNPLCLEDRANSDGHSPYVKPSRFPASNDRMALTCSDASPCAVVP